MSGNLSMEAIQEGYLEVQKWMDELLKKWDFSKEPYYNNHIFSTTLGFYDAFQDTMAEIPNNYIMESIEKLCRQSFFLGWLYRDRPEEFEALYKRLVDKHGLEQSRYKQGVDSPGMKPLNEFFEESDAD